MKQNKWIALGLAAALSLGLFAGCAKEEEKQDDQQPQDEKTENQDQNGSQDAEGGDLLQRIKDKGEIVVAMEGTWAPWTYHDETDALVGYDVEVAQGVAKRLGVDVTFVEGEWDGLLAGLDAGRYDIMVNGVDIDEARSEKLPMPIIAPPWSSAATTTRFSLWRIWRAKAPPTPSPAPMRSWRNAMAPTSQAWTT